MKKALVSIPLELRFFVKLEIWSQSILSWTLHIYTHHIYSVVCFYLVIPLISVETNIYILDIFINHQWNLQSFFIHVNIILVNIVL